MKMLEKTNPDLYQSLSKFGCFVNSRSRKHFSAMGLYQRHEQQRKDVKGDVGLLDW